jgi:hypothetical protein
MPKKNKKDTTLAIPTLAKEDRRREEKREKK